MLAEALSEPGDEALRSELTAGLAPMYSDRADDVRLSFYTPTTLTHREELALNGPTASFTIYLPVDDYRHHAVAGVGANAEAVDNPIADLASAHALLARTPAAADAETAPAHSAPIFTGRLPLPVAHAGRDHTMHLYMANCAAVLAIDTRGHAVEELTCRLGGLADRFSVDDSVYSHSGKALPIDAGAPMVRAGNRVAYMVAGFPSRDSRRGRADEPEGLWHWKAYVKIDGKYTESTLAVKSPLRAGGLHVIKALLDHRGALVTTASDVGVSVKLDWTPGGEYNPDL